MLDAWGVGDLDQQDRRPKLRRRDHGRAVSREGLALAVRSAGGNPDQRVVVNVGDQPPKLADVQGSSLARPDRAGLPPRPVARLAMADPLYRPGGGR